MARSDGARYPREGWSKNERGPRGPRGPRADKTEDGDKTRLEFCLVNALSSWSCPRVSAWSAPSAFVFGPPLGNFMSRDPDTIRARLAPFYATIDGVLVGQRPLVDRLARRPPDRRPRPPRRGARRWPRRSPSAPWPAALRPRRSRRIQFTPGPPARPTWSAPRSTTRGPASSRPSKGPVFANVVLADEINRAPAKVQSALLEAMQERQVTIGDATFPLARAVPRAGDPEPDRAGGDVPAARGAGRPLHAQGAGGLPEPRRGTRGARPGRRRRRRGRPSSRSWRPDDLAAPAGAAWTRSMSTPR